MDIETIFNLTNIYRRAYLDFKQLIKTHRLWSNPFSIYSPDPLQLQIVMYNSHLKEHKEQVRIWSEDIKERIAAYKESQNGNDEYDEAVRRDIFGEELGEEGAADMHKDAHPSPSYACPKCSKLSSLLSEMASNPPGRRGVETPSGRFGNAHIDLGWTAAVNMLVERLEQEEDTLLPAE